MEGIEIQATIGLQELKVPIMKKCIIHPIPNQFHSSFDQFKITYTTQKAKIWNV